MEGNHVATSKVHANGHEPRGWEKWMDGEGGIGLSLGLHARGERAASGTCNEDQFLVW